MGEIFCLKQSRAKQSRQACLARRAWLKRARSRKPMPPLSFAAYSVGWFVKKYCWLVCVRKILFCMKNTVHINSVRVRGLASTSRTGCSFGDFVPGKPMNFPSFVFISSPKISYQLLEFITKTCREFKDTHSVSRDAL